MPVEEDPEESGEVPAGAGRSTSMEVEGVGEGGRKVRLEI